eukprot:scaffold149_cov315-Pinguiococcus_pyrenoidosus.AAC.132
MLREKLVQPKHRDLALLPRSDDDLRLPIIRISLPQNRKHLRRHEPRAACKTLPSLQHRKFQEAQGGKEERERTSSALFPLAQTKKMKPKRSSYSSFALFSSCRTPSDASAAPDCSPDSQTAPPDAFDAANFARKALTSPMRGWPEKASSQSSSDTLFQISSAYRLSASSLSYGLASKSASAHVLLWQTRRSSDHKAEESDAERCSADHSARSRHRKENVELRTTYEAVLPPLARRSKSP